MRRIVRAPDVKPDHGPGVFIGALALVGVIAAGWLSWWTLLLVLLAATTIDAIANHTRKDR